MRDLGRVLTAMVTPFTPEGKVDFEETARLARYLVDNGSDGLVVTGTTGESATLTDEEKLELYRTVKKEVGERAAVIAGTGSNNTAATVELTVEAEKAGADGIMLVAPYYNKPSQEGMYQHFKTVAEKTKLPVIVYNVPGRTSANILPATVARLAQVDNIVAIKEASGSLDQVSELISLLPADFAVYSGDDSLTLPMLSLGAKGVISVASHVAGKMLQEMIRAFLAGEITKASRLHIQLYPLFKVLFITTNPVPVKAALNMIGLKAGPPRLPLVEASDQEKEAIKKVLQQLALL